MSKPLSPVYGDCYARWYSSELRIHYNADMEEIPDESGAAGKPEEEGRRLHDMYRRQGTINEAEAREIQRAEDGRRQAQKAAEAEAAIKRECDLVSKSLRSAGVGEGEINRQCEAIRLRARGEEPPEVTEPVTGTAEESAQEEASTKEPDRPRPPDALGALVWDVEMSKTREEREQVLQAAHHQTLSNLVVQIDLDPAIGDNSKQKNVAMVMAKLDAED